jgi:hypothetical protein
MAKTLTLRQLIAETPRAVGLTARDLLIRGVKLRKRPMLGITAAVVSQTTPPQKYETSITVTDPKYTSFSRAPVKVSCSCPHFMYTCEVALATRGNADIKYSNGAMPTYTNPSLAPILCKHLMALALTVLAKEAQLTAQAQQQQPKPRKK